jgi:hypothetical protein
MRELREHKNECLYVLGLGKSTQIGAVFVVTHLVMALPILVYAFFTMGVGFQNHLYGPVMGMLGIQIFCVLGSAALYRYCVQRAHVRIQLPFSLSFRIPLSLPYYLYFGSDLVQQRKLMLIVCKTLSIVVLWGGLLLMKAQDLDIRIGWMCMVASATIHVIILQKLREMEDETMAWMGNLPFSPLQRFGGYLLFFVLLLLPEMLFLLKFVPEQVKWMDLPFFLGIGVAGLSQFHSLLFKKGMNSEKFNNQVFFYWLLYTFSIQFKVPVYLVIVGLLGLSFWQYTSRYYQYEVFKGAESS